VQRDLLAPNVDVRSTGGYVILWHLAGCSVLSDAPIAPWPAPLLQLLAEAQETQRTPSAAERASPMNVKNGALVSIARDQELPKTLYFKMCELMPGSSGRDGRRVRELLKIVLQKHEGRNDNLNRIAFIFQKLISSGVIDYAAAEQLLLDAAWINGYVAKDGVRAALATIRSGLGHQTQEPHQIFYFLW
jgi:hypothetical protein